MGTSAYPRSCRAGGIITYYWEAWNGIQSENAKTFKNTNGSRNIHALSVMGTHVASSGKALF